MADTVTTQTLVDGPRKVVMVFQNQSDGTGESAVAKVDVTTLTAKSDGTTPTAVSIQRIKYATQGMAVKILWDATTDVLAWSLPQDHAAELDFAPIGGLQNNAGSGKTGNIMFTTVGHTAGDSYSIELEMVKK